MPQIFHHSTNALAKTTIFGAVFILVAALWVTAEISRSSWNTGQWVEIQQPLQFSHKHHAGDDGIDCRYCHTSVENSATAGVPPTKTCMNCHSVLFNNVGYLEPVRESYRTGESIQWVKVHRLGDFAYFNHSIHISKGVGCSTCHGAVNQMPLVFQANTLLMQWCLDCHRNPEMALRPLDQVYNMDWKAPENQAELGAKFAQERKIRTTVELTSCSTCHR